jgi:glycine cleavage system H lipoate-binding protein
MISSENLQDLYKIKHGVYKDGGEGSVTVGITMELLTLLGDMALRVEALRHENTILRQQRDRQKK